MTPTETADILRQFNEWQRGHNTVLRPSSNELGEAIDAAVDMIERLEAAEAEAIEEARLNGMGSEREAALMARLEAAEKERDTLRAEVQTWQEQAKAYWSKIEQMERQEPVVWMQSSHLSSFKNRLCGSQSAYVHCGDHQLHPYFKPLYALPGAQPAPSIPEAVMEVIAGLIYEVERNVCQHEETHRGGFMWEICDSCGAKWADDEGGKPEFKWPKVVERAYAMLAAAPETKPCP